MAGNKEVKKNSLAVLTPGQEEVLDLYLQNLDDFYATIKEAEKVQVEIETLHLKRILTK